MYISFGKSCTIRFADYSSYQFRCKYTTKIAYTQILSDFFAEITTFFGSMQIYFTSCPVTVYVLSPRWMKSWPSRKNLVDNW